jgi:hypothetical protein
MDRAWLDQQIGEHPQPPQRAVMISEVVTLHTAQFEWVRPLRGLEIIDESGTLIARDGSREIRTPHDHAVMVMPVPSPKLGQTAVRIGRFV